MTATARFHDIVPDGDVTLVLYDSPFPGVKDGIGEREKERVPGGRPMEDGLGQNGSVSLFGPVSYQTQSTAEGEKKGVPTTAPSRPETRIRVSSHHLVNASCVFRAMLSGDRFSESHSLQKLGHAEVCLPEDDAEVILLIMNIVHLRSSNIPRTVSLDMLARVAVAVDKYAMHEALGFVTSTWILHLRNTESLPNVVGDELIKWVFVGAIFGLKDVLRVLETTAAGGARTRLDHWDYPQLPIPGSLIDSIERRRQDLVEQTLGILEQTIQSYIRPARHQGELHCFQQRELCDLAVLGSLVKGAANHGLYPPPKRPYEGYSPNEIVEVLGTFVLGAGGKCVASGFITCGGTTLGKMLAEAEGVRARALREEGTGNDGG